MYNDKNLINIMQNDDAAMGMIFGIFGREEGCLVINNKTGGM